MPPKRKAASRPLAERSSKRGSAGVDDSDDDSADETNSTDGDGDFDDGGNESSSGSANDTENDEEQQRDDDAPPSPQDRPNTPAYVGPVQKWDRRRTLVRAIYGRTKSSLDLIQQLITWWGNFALPFALTQGWAPPTSTAGSGLTTGEILPSPWLPEHFEEQQMQAYQKWYRGCRAGLHDLGEARFTQVAHAIDADSAAKYLPHKTGETLMAYAVRRPGSASEPDPAMVCAGTGSCWPLRVSGEAAASGAGPGDNSNDKEPKHPDSADTHPRVFTFHAGGSVESIAWAPLAQEIDQLLAVAASPYVGDMYLSNEQELGSVQLWKLPITNKDESRRHGILHSPRLWRVLCMSWGRPRQVLWCPVLHVHDEPHPSYDPSYGLLAILSRDGLLRVVDVEDAVGDEPLYYLITEPLATLGLADSAATCMTWVGTNRIALGHKEGSITLWSVQPPSMLLRIAAHTSPVLDVCSGYPSHPYMVASRPSAGVMRLTDLSESTSKHSFNPSPTTSFQANVLGWSDHMQGFAAMSPSNNPQKIRLDFQPIRHFPRSLVFLPSRRGMSPSCLSVSPFHPFVLVGHRDGSLVVCNMLQKVFSSGNDGPRRILVLQSKFRSMWPQPESDSGGPELLGGTAVSLELCDDPADEPAASKPANRAGRKSRQENEQDSGPESDQEETGATVIHESMTAMASVAWNPNIEFGTWMAAATSSGVVLIMDLDQKHV